MTWIQKYRIRYAIRSSVWIVPLTWAVAAGLAHRAIWTFDLWAQWKLLDYTPEGARALVGSISSSMLTFIVFQLTMVFIGVQIAVSQLTPRIIVATFRDRVIKMSLGIFLFTYVFSVSLQGRIRDPVPQLTVLLTVVFTLVSIGTFLYLVGYIGKALRPVNIVTKAAEEGIRAVETIYPVRLKESEGVVARENLFRDGKPPAVICYKGRSGELMAFDARGLAEVAGRAGCVIRLLPQVGDFVARGDPLFHVYQGGETIQERVLHQSVALGTERTIEQDPAFAFRIIVDVAIKALSPAINDPTTAVRGIDQIHHLLRILATRNLGDGRIRDREGRLRVVFPTPNWEDHVRLGVSEIRLYGAGSIQVMRRLRAMLEDLIEVVPPDRTPVLREQLRLLERSVERNFLETRDRAVAGVGDYQGLGGSRLSHASDAGAME
jgi:uncharacterized membrane protein